MIQQVNHIGIAVPNVREATRFYTQTLGMPIYNIENKQDRSLLVASFPTGDTTIELIEPRDTTSSVGKFLKRHGPGVHHIAFGIKGFANEVERLQRQGIKITEFVSGSGNHHEGASVFLHPKSSWGVLIQLVEETD